MKRQFALAALAIISITCLAAAPRPTPLIKDPIDGKWILTVTPDDDARTAGEKEFKDNIEFKGGKFTSESMQKHGFEPGPTTKTPPAAAWAPSTPSSKAKPTKAKPNGTAWSPPTK